MGYRPAKKMSSKSWKALAHFKTGTGFWIVLELSETTAAQTYWKVDVQQAFCC